MMLSISIETLLYVQESPDYSNAPVAVADPNYLKHFMQPMCTIDTTGDALTIVPFARLLMFRGER
jgi:hypothetical protein